MGLTLKRLYLDFLCQRYQTTQYRKVKIMIIDQLVRDAVFHLKHAIRTLNQKAEIKGKRGRKKSYSNGARYHLKRLWFSVVKKQ